MTLKDEVKAIIKDGETCGTTHGCEGCKLFPLWDKLHGDCSKIVDVLKAVLELGK